MLRVLMLATDLQRGGLPLRLAKLAARLQRSSVEPIVGCLSPPGPLSDLLAGQGVTTFSCDAAGPLDFSCFMRLARHIERIDPNLIHASLFHANLAARLTGRLDRARPIITSTVTIEIERPLHRILESLTGGLSDLHVANSQAVAAHLLDDLAMDPRRVVVIPNAIDLGEIEAARAAPRSSLGFTDSLPLIVWAGRMDPVKDLPTLVEVIARVHEKTDVQALLLGDGRERLKIEQEIASRGLTSVIRLAGWSQEVVGWLKSADLLLFPSLTEGSPNAVLEAMACECSVVASDIPSCRELIRNGVDGLLCHAQDANGFTEAVMKMLDDRGLARRMATNARVRVVERHEVSNVVEQWSDLYRRLMGEVG